MAEPRHSQRLQQRYLVEAIHSYTLFRIAMKSKRGVSEVRERLDELIEVKRKLRARGQAHFYRILFT
jgi:hypothetical protein